MGMFDVSSGQSSEVCGLAGRVLEIAPMGYLEELPGDGQSIHISSGNDYGYWYLSSFYLGS